VLLPSALGSASHRVSSKWAWVWHSSPECRARAERRSFIHDVPWAPYYFPCLAIQLRSGSSEGVMPMFGVWVELIAAVRSPPKMSFITAPAHFEKYGAVRHPGTALHAPYRA
jgi:hypothetical protein